MQRGLSTLMAASAALALSFSLPFFSPRCWGERGGQAPPAAARPARQAPYAARVETLGSGRNSLTALYLSGTPYEMGRQQGELLGKRIAAFYTRVATAMSLGLHVSLHDVDNAYAQMEPYVPSEYKEEMRGLADGAGLPLKMVQRAQAIPDLTEYHCSFYAAWGKATLNGHLIQLRALDYAMSAGIQQDPALIVYRPNNGIPWVNVGWIGMVGTVTGMNADGIAMSEIGDRFGDEHETLQGEPFPLMMRDVLQHSTSLDEGVRRVREAKRTSSLLYCIGDGRHHDARALVTAMDLFKVYTDCEEPYAPARTSAKPLPQVVYLSMNCTSGKNGTLYDRLVADYGHLDPPTAIGDILPRIPTGGLHAVLFDATSRELWVANSTAANRPAYNEPYVHFDLKQALKER